MRVHRKQSQDARRDRVSAPASVSRRPVNSTLVHHGIRVDRRRSRRSADQHHVHRRRGRRRKRVERRQHARVPGESAPGVPTVGHGAEHPDPAADPGSEPGAPSTAPAAANVTAGT